jgi:hypothetical protein
MQKYPFLTLKLVQGPDLRFNQSGPARLPSWSIQVPICSGEIWKELEKTKKMSPI